MNRFLLCLTLWLATVFVEAQETYKVGSTEYYYGQYYFTTGKPMVKRSEANRSAFLRSEGYTDVPVGFEVDHIIPLSEGGSDDPANMQLITIEQHDQKTASERARNSISTYERSPTWRTSSTPTPAYSTPSGTDQQGRTTYTGERGGEYYINSNGNKTYIKRESDPTLPPANGGGGGTIHTGPRGGKYYINSNGNKTYIKRK